VRRCRMALMEEVHRIALEARGRGAGGFHAVSSGWVGSRVRISALGFAFEGGDGGFGISKGATMELGGLVPVCVGAHMVERIEADDVLSLVQTASACRGCDGGEGVG